MTAAEKWAHLDESQLFIGVNSDFRNFYLEVGIPLSAPRQWSLPWSSEFIILRPVAAFTFPVGDKPSHRTSQLQQK
jgi:hypothetical protein